MNAVNTRERSALQDGFIILIKFLISAGLIYLQLNKPNIYLRVPIIESLAHAVMIFSIASLSISIIRLLLITLYTRKHRLPSNIHDNFILGINRIVSVLNTVFVVIALMIFMGINPKEFLTSITIVAAAIAITFKDYINNMINGLIIMFSDRLSLGDYIKINDEDGKIIDITLLNIILQNEDNDMVLIPNSVAFSSTVINQTKQNVRKVTIDFELEHSLGYFPALLEEKLRTAIVTHTDLLVVNGLLVKTVSIKKEFTHFKVQVLLNNYDRLREREIRRTLNTKILELSRNPATTPEKIE